MSIANEYSPYPPARFLTPMPTHFIVIVIAHSLWDGGLFLIGFWLVKKTCPTPHFKKYNLNEIGVLVAWGQLQEIIVEMTSTYNEAWEYNVYWWNPVLFEFNSHNITLLPQLIWLVAALVFYYFAIKIKAKLIKEEEVQKN